MRRLVLEEGFRADGRAVSDVRPIWSRAQVLPRTHGSVLFTRGETQALAVTTLGCSRSAQRIDAMAEDEELRFYLQVRFQNRRGPALGFENGMRPLLLLLPLPTRWLVQELCRPTAPPPAVLVPAV